MAEIVAEKKGNPAEGFFDLPLSRQVMLLVGLAASIALGMYTVLWSTSPDFAPLFTQLTPRDSGDVVDALQRSGIAFKVDENSGMVLVETRKMQEAKIKLAAIGVPNNSSNGFELLDKDSVFGASQMLERARYIRAQQGELEKTIASIDHIKSARVHLAIPKQNTFLKDKKDPSASVFVDIYGGYKLESEQVSAITHLVASSIQGLSIQNVTVIDQNGKLLSSSGNDMIGAAAKQLDYTNKLERTYAQRIHDLLAPILGFDKVKAEVTATMDFTSMEETSENYDPEKTVVRSEKISDIQRRSGEDSEGAGTPGALSNVPQNPATPGKKEAPKETTSTSTTTSSNMNRQSVKNFEIDRQIRHQTKVPGKLIKLSVAVVVDDKVTYDEKGAPTKAPLTEAEMNQIENLVKDAIGFDETRGDRVTVINSSFAQAEPIEALPKKSLMDNPMVFMIAKQIIAGLLVLSLVMLVLRPALKNLSSVSSFKHTLERKELVQDPVIADGRGKKMSEEEYQIRVKELINQDPKKAAQVIKGWVGVENE